MKISRLLKILIAVYAILAAANIGSTLLNNYAANQLAIANDIRYRYTSANNDIRYVSDTLTRLARAYVVGGDTNFRTQHAQEIAANRLEATYEYFRNNGAPQSLIDVLDQSIILFDNLRSLEADAFALQDAGNYQAAIDLLHGYEYSTITLLALLNSLDQLRIGTYDYVDPLYENAQFLADTAEILVISTAMLVAAVSIISSIVMFQKIKPINKIVELLQNVADGNVNVNIDRRNISRDEIGQLQESSFNLIDIIRKLVDDLRYIHEETNVRGNLSYRMDSGKYQNSFKDMVDGINLLVEDNNDVAFIIIDAMKQISDGNFEIEIEDLPGEQMVLPQTLRSLVSKLNAIYEAARLLATEAAKGNLEVKLDTEKFSGNWADLAKTLNTLVSAVSAPILTLEESLNSMAVGNFEEARIEKSFQGAFGKIKDALNTTEEITLSYINEISDILGKMANGDLTVDISKDYVGDYAPIKIALNAILDSFNNTMSEIQSASSQVLSGAEQISQSSMYLAEGTTRQASAIEELTASIELINEKTKGGANNALTANERAQSMAEYANQGSETVKHMMGIMNNVQSSSSEIGKVIDVIKDIAFQTNLLALNASVEAARAGEHGKSFSVVADEVRSLASKSQKSAQDTADIIEEDAKVVLSGIGAATEVASSFSTIIDDILKISELTAHISNMSNEQAESIGHINTSVTEISRVVQDNSATAEQSASASEELNSQAEMLKQLVSVFSLRD